MIEIITKALGEDELSENQFDDLISLALQVVSMDEPGEAALSSAGDLVERSGPETADVGRMGAEVAADQKQIASASRHASHSKKDAESDY